MSMGLYKLFSCNVQIQYKGCLLSKAMLFTIITTVLNIILPFVVAYRSRGFWLKSYSFYEQPKVHFTYEYLLLAETEDPSQPIVCGEAAILDEDMLSGEESCDEIEVQEKDVNGDGSIDLIDIKFHLNIPSDHTIASVMLLIALDYQLKTICPLHMQSLAVINKEFTIPPSGYAYFGDIELYQIAHLPCLWNVADTKYNNSLFAVLEEGKVNVVDSILETYFRRDLGLRDSLIDKQTNPVQAPVVDFGLILLTKVKKTRARAQQWANMGCCGVVDISPSISNLTAIVTTQTKPIYSRSQNGHTGTLDLKISLRLPEIEILYTPSVMQELKWAWPQYLSLAVIFYWLFDRIKKYVFNKRLLMAWEVVPWKK